MKRDFYTRFSPAILLVVVFMLPITFAGARRALNSNKNRVEQWLPEQYAETRVYQEFRRAFQGEEFILVSWDGCEMDDQRLRMMAAKLAPAADSAIPDDERYFSKVLTGPSVVALLTEPPINLERDEAIRRLSHSLIGENGKQTCMVLTLSEQGKKNLRKTVDKIYDTAAEECNVKPQALHMGGPPSDNVAIDVAGEQSLFRLAGLAGFIGLAISWWCLRSVKLVSIVLTAGVFSAMAALAVVWYSGGEMNAIVLTMPSLVYVAAISGAIHLANYYRDTVRAEGIAGAPGRAIGMAWLPLTLATSTTAIGLLTLCYSELVPIQLFGLYSAIGVIVSVLFLFFYMPAAFQMWPLVEEANLRETDSNVIDPALYKGWGDVGRWIIRRNGLVTAAGLAVIAFCAVGLTRMETSVQLMRLFSPKAKVVTDYEWLEANLGELVPMEVVVRVDPATSNLTFLERMELIQRVQDEIEQIDEVGASLSAVTFATGIAPDDDDAPKAPPKRRSGLGVLGRTAGRLAGVRDAEQTARNVRNAKLLEHRDRMLQGDYLKEVDGHELWRISARVSALRDVDYAKFISEIEDRVEPVIQKALDSGARDVDTIYTGLVPLVYKAQNSLLDGLVFGFVTDVILIVVAIIVAMRGLSAGLILLVPAVFPPIIVFGVMGWLGILVDIGSVMTPSVALGVSVDDIVHFMLRYRRALAAGQTRQDAVMDAYHHCGRPMYQSWGVIGLGLSVFAFSPFTPTQRFGCMTIALLTATLLANLVLLPALLAGPLGRIFARGVKVTKPVGDVSGKGDATGHGAPPPPHTLPFDAAQPVAQAASGDVTPARIEPQRRSAQW